MAYENENTLSERWAKDDLESVMGPEPKEHYLDFHQGLWDLSIWISHTKLPDVDPKRIYGALLKLDMDSL